MLGARDSYQQVVPGGQGGFGVSVRPGTGGLVGDGGAGVRVGVGVSVGLGVLVGFGVSDGVTLGAGRVTVITFAGVTPTGITATGVTDGVIVAVIVTGSGAANVGADEGVGSLLLAVTISPSDSAMEPQPTKNMKTVATASDSRNKRLPVCCGIVLQAASKAANASSADR